jgi:hypothetical protein
MLKVLEAQEQEKLIKAIARSIRDTSKMDQDAYRFVSCASGFIAHFNLHGFIYEYQDKNALRDAMIRNLKTNQWNNFSPRDRDYDYMMQKKHIYNEALRRVIGTDRLNRELRKSHTFFAW